MTLEFTKKIIVNFETFHGVLETLHSVRLLRGKRTKEWRY